MITYITLLKNEKTRRVSLILMGARLISQRELQRAAELFSRSASEN